MRKLLIVGTFAVSAVVSACSNSQNTAIPALLGFKVAIAEPGPDGVRIDKDGVFANFFPLKTGKRSPAVLLLSGSEGGLSHDQDAEIEDLTRSGFNVLYQCYFGCPGTPHHLVAVPLETFDRGLAFLRAQPGVDPERIGVVGESKGAEAALLVGTRNPKLKAVVAGMPSSVVWPGIQLALRMHSSWSAGGTPIAYLPYSYGSFFFHGIRGVYAGALPNNDKHPGAVISVERITGPILLVCGEADTLWPSCPMADEIATRLKAKGRPPATVLRYKDAGHKVFGSPLGKTSSDYSELASVGGTVDGNAAARIDSWPKTIAFLRASLGP